MFQKKIILDATDSLTLTWEKNWASLHVKHNNQAIGSFVDKTLEYVRNYGSER